MKSNKFEIQGFYPYWAAKNLYTKLRMDLLSTIAWCDAEAKKDGTFSLRGDDPTELIKYAHDNGVKVVIVLGSASSESIDTILSNDNIRNNLIDSLIDVVKLKNFDGIDIDFEGINKINSINNNPNRHLLTEFITILSDKFKKININYRISIDLPSVDWNDLWDMSNLQEKIDYAMIMSYDYHWQSSPIAGPISPICSDPSGSPSVSNSIKYYCGIMNKNKLLLGIPYYGYEWKTLSNIKLSPTIEIGDSITYKNIIDRSSKYKIIWESTWKTPWYVYQKDNQWYQGHFDDKRSLSIKYGLVKKEMLAGIGIWALGYDNGRPELWKLIKTKLMKKE